MFIDVYLRCVEEQWDSKRMIIRLNQLCDNYKSSLMYDNERVEPNMNLCYTKSFGILLTVSNAYSSFLHILVISCNVSFSLLHV